MDIGIYEILNTINNKRYIGSSTSLYKRKWHHKKHLIVGDHCNPHLQAAWNKYGKDSFKFKTLIICDLKDLLFYENLIITEYKANQPDFGYNIRKVTESNLGCQASNSPYKPGNKYNRITLLERTTIRKTDGYRWLAECDCGKRWLINPWHVRKGIVKSCGCLNKELASALMFRQHADPEWSSRHRKRSSAVMKRTRAEMKLNKGLINNG